MTHVNKNVIVCGIIASAFIAGFYSHLFITSYIPSDSIERPLSPIPHERIVTPSPIFTSIPIEKKELHFLRLVAPKGSESFCLGKDMDIAWESEGIDTVKIYLTTRADNLNRVIGSFPADFNESGEKGEGLLRWKVGNLKLGGSIPEGYTYKIYLTDSDSDVPQFKDETKGLISILRCDG